MPLPNGQILFNNRMGPSGLALYNPGVSADPSWLPKITNVATDLNAGSTYSVTGKQLSGLTAGAAFGDDWGTTSNYSMIQITNIATGKVTYQPTVQLGTYAVTPNFESTTTFTVNSDAVNGPSTLRVVSGLFASDPVNVTISNGQPAPTPTPSKTVKPTTKKTLTCTKGKIVKKVPAANPKCPTGYKKK
jgi:hypothetical protein